jgi:hypothetical protein
MTAVSITFSIKVIKENGEQLDALSQVKSLLESMCC